MFMHGLSLYFCFVGKHVLHSNTTQTPYRKIAQLIISSAAILPSLAPNIAKLVLSKTRERLSLFISEDPSFVPFKIGIEHYVTLICRVIKSREFEDVEYYKFISKRWKPQYLGYSGNGEMEAAKARTLEKETFFTTWK
ncbi:hypothetical protein L1987_34656 [Smallanthus sonchifolius]|uniref:Uncharacterized protein n=1 Tax=Smallanthus sonchifolius TaxID=185202 RepID=A0ACB9HX16_9ASTR|nr:hypothetical protein L1987_34656 [Smallanthus sonchifolius]